MQTTGVVWVVVAVAAAAVVAAVVVVVPVVAVSVAVPAVLVAAVVVVAPGMSPRLPCEQHRPAGDVVVQRLHLCRGPRSTPLTSIDWHYSCSSN